MRHVVLPAILCVLMTTRAWAVVPPTISDELAPPVPVTAAGQPIQVAGNAAPFVGDFDDDGKRDLLVGQFELGRLRIYRNVGDDRRPQFAASEWFRAERQIAGVPTGCNVGFTPQLVDFDGDGLTDILTGSFRSELYLFRRKPDGSFRDAEVLENKDGEVFMRRSFPGGRQSRYNSTVVVHDWDGDGDNDLLVGRSGICLVVNEGTAMRPVFGTAQPILVAGQPIAFGRIGPCLADWDGDGRMDLLMGRGTEIVWYRDQARQGPPDFAAPQLLIRQANVRMGGSEPMPPEPCQIYAICVADLNGDDRLDLLVGDEYRQRVPRAASVADSAEKARLTQAGRRMLYAEYQQLRRDPATESRQQRIERHRAAVAKWQQYAPLQLRGATTRRYGRVWLYARVNDS